MIRRRLLAALAAVGLMAPAVVAPAATAGPLTVTASQTAPQGTNGTTPSPIPAQAALAAIARSAAEGGTAGMPWPWWTAFGRRTPDRFRRRRLARCS